MKKLLIIVTILFTSHGYLKADESFPSSCIDEACFPNDTKIGDKNYPLIGTAKFRYYGFRVYAAALYGDKSTKRRSEILNSVPKKLVIHYFREFTEEDFKTSGLEVMKSNPEVIIDKIKDQISSMDSLYKPIKPGDRYEITYLPGTGTSLSLNGLDLGSVTGDEFAKSYFGIWLSNYSIGKNFTQELLGQS